MRVITVTLLHKKWTPVIKSRFDSYVLRSRRQSSDFQLTPLRTVSTKISDHVVTILSETYTPEIVSNLKELREDYTFPLFTYQESIKRNWKETPRRLIDKMDCFKITKTFCSASLRRMLRGERDVA
jgi:hypothetical protein